MLKNGGQIGRTMVENQSGYQVCPACQEKKLKYDNFHKVDHCYNPNCLWMDMKEITAAPDVSIGFLEFCLSTAAPGRPRELLEGIIAKTKELHEQCKRYV